MPRDLFGSGGIFICIVDSKNHICMLAHTYYRDEKLYDPLLAYQFAQKARVYRNIDASLLLARILMDGNFLEKDLVESEKILLGVVRHESPQSSQAVYLLGVLYFEHHKDYEKAYGYFLRSWREMHNPDSLYYLGLQFEKGLGVMQDEYQASLYYELGIRAGENTKECREYLANLYEKGVGVPKDVEKAKVLRTGPED